MIDNINAIDRIEFAERETPSCCACGEPMVPVAHADGIWLQCASFKAADRGPVARFLVALNAQGHDRRLVVEQAA